MIKTSPILRAGAVVAALSCCGRAAYAEGIDPEAAKVLAGMTDYLKGLKAFSAKYDIDIESVDYDGQKLQYSSYGAVDLARPDRLRASRKGAVADAEVVLDGKQITFYGKNLNTYVQTPAASIDEAVDIVRNNLHIEAPAMDFLYSEPFDPDEIDLVSGVHVGMTTIGGVPVHHLAFRGKQTDWQIWVQDGDKPLPMKYVITSKWVTAAPQYSIRFTDWNTAPAADQQAFVFNVPDGAKKAEYVSIDGIGEFVSEEETPK
jgi:hypothetical protein